MCRAATCKMSSIKIMLQIRYVHHKLGTRRECVRRFQRKCESIRKVLASPSRVVHRPTYR